MSSQHDGIDNFAHPNSGEGAYAEAATRDGDDLGDAAYHVGEERLPLDFVLAHPEKFYTRVPMSWFDKTCARQARVNSYYVGANADPVQILRANSLRRGATVLLCCVGDANAMPIAVAPSRNELSNQYIKSLGAYVNGTPLPQGPFGLIPVSPQNVAWNSQTDLWAVAPWATVGAYFITTVEYFD